MPIRRKKKMDLTLPTASMGDIAFLLIIFFVLSSNFMKSSNVEVERPSAPALEAVEDASVEVIVDRRGTVFVQGLEVDVPSVESAVLQAVGERRNRPVHLTVDRNLSKKDFMPVVEALSAAGVGIVIVGDRN